MKFTAEELEELRRADEEIERDFRWTSEELAASRKRDANISLLMKSERDRSIAEKQRAYYEANKDSIAEKQRWIRDKRLAYGYSQHALAKIVGVSQPMIARLESGEAKLESFFAKDVLCAILGQTE